MHRRPFPCWMHPPLRRLFAATAALHRNNKGQMWPCARAVGAAHLRLCGRWLSRRSEDLRCFRYWGMLATPRRQSPGKPLPPLVPRCWPQKWRGWLAWTQKARGREGAGADCFFAMREVAEMMKLEDIAPCGWPPVCVGEQSASCLHLYCCASAARCNPAPVCPSSQRILSGTAAKLRHE